MRDVNKYSLKRFRFSKGLKMDLIVKISIVTLAVSNIFLNKRICTIEEEINSFKSMLIKMIERKERELRKKRKAL